MQVIHSGAGECAAGGSDRRATLASPSTSRISKPIVDGCAYRTRGRESRESGRAGYAIDSGLTRGRSRDQVDATLRYQGFLCVFLGDAVGGQQQALGQQQAFERLAVAPLVRRAERRPGRQTTSRSMPGADARARRRSQPSITRHTTATGPRSSASSGCILADRSLAIGIGPGFGEEQPDQVVAREPCGAPRFQGGRLALRPSSPGARRRGRSRTSRPRCRLALPIRERCERPLVREGEVNP